VFWRSARNEYEKAETHMSQNVGRRYILIWETSPRALFHYSVVRRLSNNEKETKMKFDLNLATNILAFIGVVIQSYVQFSNGTVDLPSAISTVLGAVALYFIGKDK
jgi:hypothetical protein